ncbi:MAG: hypothetical protein RSC49_03620, partial [Clostridium sp.]
MEKSSFFNAELIGYDSSNNPIYDREFYAEDFAEFIASFIGNGVYPNPASNLQVVGIDNNMKITIQAGNAWILGRFYQNTDVLNMDISVADGVLNRIDRVVLRLDYLNREIKAYVKKGRPSSNPTAPELVRDADMYELGLADIRINAGAIKITSADITDLRLNNTCCGVVHGTIDQVDTTAIFNQYKVWFDSKVLEYGKDFAAFEASQKGALQAFVDEFKNSLDPNSDVAIQLASKITVNET